jgi:hypothetical protein
MKQFFLFILTFLITKNIIAQNNRLRYGIKTGISIGKISIWPPLQNRTESYGAGIVAGGMIQVPILKKMKVQIEPLYNLHHSSLTFNPASAANAIDLSLHQVSVPVQLCYFIAPNLSINAGGSANYSFYFTQNVTMTNGGNPTFNITDEIIKFQPGILGGITYYATDNFFVDLRYNRMLNNLYKKTRTDDPTEYHLGFFQLTIGYRF